MAKGSKRHVVPPRSRTTRLHKPKLTDPDRNSAELDVQLSALGLKIHQTLGDGNCLFRALSDQLYGSEAYHATLRAEITTWMAAHPERYGGFVEDDRGLDEHLRCMRMLGTYGGHLELSAFAHLKHKNVKVIQPGLVYVIEWNAGSPIKETFGSASDSDSHVPTSPAQERQIRRARREKLRETKIAKKAIADTVYVAYHDWEHFSSVRTLSGTLPSAAPPADDMDHADQQPIASTSTTLPPVSTIVVKKPRGRPRKYPLPTPAVVETAPTPAMIPLPLPSPAPDAALTPAHIPLPRSLSPSTNSSSADSTASSSLAPLTPSDSNSATMSLAEQAKSRSPKRLLEDDDLDVQSSGAEMSETRSAKRRAGGVKSGLRQSHHLPNTYTSRLSESSTPSSSRPPVSRASTSDQSEDVSDGTRDDEGEDHTIGRSSILVHPTSTTPRLTRRQRKQLGLPKPRPRRVILTVNGKRPSGAGPPPSSKASSVADEVIVDDSQWVKNGHGRLDVRGFRELKI